MSIGESMETFSITHQGRVRENNQDRFLVKEFDDASILLAVADGLGGEAAGDRAAKMAKESLDDFNPHSKAVKARLVELLQAADRRILESVEKDPDLRGMGTTMTVAFVRKGVVDWAHVGDSRLYLFRGGELVQITEDNTIPALLLKDGEISKEEARVHPMRNILLQCIGYGQFEADTGTFVVRKGDLLLLSTDGLHDEVPQEIIVSILVSKSNLKEKLEALVSAALDEGGRDNVTAVGAQV